MKIEEVRLAATVADHRKGPRDPLPRFAFAGRSNVGKSSLLNTLFGQRLAGVSKTPGKTRTLNYYLINRACYFVDLPGYGYARTSQAERAAWGERISAFLAEEDRLRMVLGLVDPRIPTSPLDVELVDFVRAAGRPLLIVLTKTDRTKRGELARAADRLTRELGLERRPIPFSAVTGDGRREILAAISETLAA